MIALLGAAMMAVAGWFGLAHHHLTGHAITVVRVVIFAGGLLVVSWIGGWTRFM